MRIQSLKPSARIQGRWLATLEDGTLLTLGEQQVVEFALGTGVELSDEKIQEILQSVSQGKHKEKALALLSRKPMSRKTLEGKLREWEADEDEITTLCDRLEELNFLDDARYAVTIVEHYSKKGYGKRKLTQELYQRGIPRELWEDALEQLEDNSEAVDAFLMKKLKGDHDPKAIKHASDALIRRGFSWDEVREGLRRYDSEMEFD